MLLISVRRRTTSYASLEEKTDQNGRQGDIWRLVHRFMKYTLIGGRAALQVVLTRCPFTLLQELIARSDKVAEEKENHCTFFLVIKQPEKLQAMAD